MMEQITLTGKSMDIIEDNISKLNKIFPEVFNEDKVDFEKLKEILGEKVDSGNERYNFSWAGKSEAIRKAQQQSTETLRPCKEESKNWDTTNNLYIEGDNLEVLKLLQKTYHDEIKAIYIDPPYNTGNNILYFNDFSEGREDYLKITGQIDDDNKPLSPNKEEDGRFHTNWLNMIYPVLKLGRNLLSNDGLLFVAIDDHEFSRLKIICDEIYGEVNFIGTIVTRCNPQGRGKKRLDPTHEYHLVYAKDISNIDDLRLKKNNTKQEYQTFMRSGTNSRKYERPKRFYPMLVKDGHVSTIKTEEYEKIYYNDSFDEEFIENLTSKYEDLGYDVIFPISKNGEEKVWQRTHERALNECDEYIYEKGAIKTPKDQYRTPQSLWLDSEFSNISQGTNKIKELFDNQSIFDFPKSIITVENLISLASEGIILDFFSGSATTAHAVFKYNQDFGKNNRFIMIQIPSSCEENSSARNNNFKNICEIGKERIRRAGNKILEESENKDLDIGFKVFKLDSSNLEKWDPDYNNLQESLFVDIIKEDRTKEDLIYEIMIKIGIDLTLPIKEENNFYIIGHTLLINLEDNVTKETSNELLGLIEKYPIKRVVFKDSGFKSDSDKFNIKEILMSKNIEKFITI